MPDIMVFKAFRLNMDGKTIIKFATGLNVDVPREQVDHWWTRLHASPVNTKADLAVNKPPKPAATAVVKMPPTRRRRA